jgi:hypothetical protein
MTGPVNLDRNPRFRPAWLTDVDAVPVDPRLAWRPRWADLVCPKCRSGLVMTAQPDVYRVDHAPWCARQCRTVCEFVPGPDGGLQRQFRLPATTAEPFHRGCRWCAREVDWMVRRAALRHDIARMHALCEWAGGVPTGG